MEIRYFSSWSNPLKFHVDSNMMLIAELFADTLTVGGEPALALYFNQIKDKLSTAQKMNFLYAYAQQERIQDDTIEELISGVDFYNDIVKSGISKVAKNPKQFIEFKKLEKILLGVFDTLSKEYEKIIKNSEFSTLRKLKETDTIKLELETLSRFGASRKQSNPIKEAEKILDFIFPRNNIGQPTILLLPAMAFVAHMREYSKILKKNEELGLPKITLPSDFDSYYKAYDETPDFTEAWVFTIIEDPLTNILTPLELLQVKKELQQPIADLNECVNRWIACRNKPVQQRDELAATHIEVYNSRLVLDNLLKKHPFYTTLEKEKTKLRVYSDTIIFSIKMEKLWEYFEKSKVLHPDTLEALRTITANNATYPRIVPVMGMTVFDEKSDGGDTKDQKTTADIISRKKSIDLDDL